MELNGTLQTGVVFAALCLLAVDKLLAILKTRGLDLHKIAKQIDDLYDWHNVTSANGVKAWYTKNQEIVASLQRQEALLQKQLELLVGINARLEVLEQTFGMWSRNNRGCGNQAVQADSRPGGTGKEK